MLLALFDPLADPLFDFEVLIYELQKEVSERAFWVQSASDLARATAANSDFDYCAWIKMP